jgi:uncharacterized protein YunC (DUF1805 family)
VLKYRKIKVGRKILEAIVFKLSAKNLIVIRGRRGYVMCGYLNLDAANKFGDVAVKIVAVASLRDALKTKVFDASRKAKKLGIRKNQPIKDVLKIIA